MTALKIHHDALNVQRMGALKCTAIMRDFFRTDSVFTCRQTQSNSETETTMEPLNDTSLLIVGAIILAVLVVSSMGNLASRQEPQVIYIQAIPVQQEQGSGCLPLMIIGGLILALLLFGQ